MRFPSHVYPNALLVLTHAEMPSSDYSNAVGGGLKLKGAKDAGVKKHKKSKKAKAVDGESTEKSSEQTALQVALADEERLDGENGTAREIRETEVKEYGKTEAQKRQEERRRKRVSAYTPCSELCPVHEAVGTEADQNHSWRSV